jgi:APA family basic amino acid/polyamine antiporter
MSLFRTKNIQKTLDMVETSPSLRRDLNAFDLTLLGVGAIVGTGIFVLTGKGALIAGPALIVSFILGGFVCMLTALCYAEFASTIPVSGSAYTYSYATLGEFAAWVIGWNLVLEYALASATVSAGWSGYFQSFLRGFDIHLPTKFTAAYGARPGEHTWFNLPAFCIVMFLTWLLSMGIRESKRMNGIAVSAKILAILLFVITGFSHVKPANWTPFMPFGWEGVMHGAAIVFFSYLGFDAVTCAAEEVKTPSRSIPIGIIASLIICVVLYVIVALIMTGIVPFPLYAYTDHPVSLALQYAHLDKVAGFIDLGAILGMAAVILVMTYGQTRIFFAMSRDGLLPPIFSKVNKRYQTPYLATWLIGFIIALVGATVPLTMLAEVANIGTLSAFAMISFSVIVLRRTHPHLPRKFTCPGVPYLPFTAMLFCVYLMLHLSDVTWYCFIGWMLIGLVIYFAYSRKHSLLCPVN